jgi:hypothetical protein
MLKRQLVRLQFRPQLQRRIDVILDDPGLEMRLLLVTLALETPEGRRRFVGIRPLTCLVPKSPVTP